MHIRHHASELASARSGVLQWPASAARLVPLGGLQGLLRGRRDDSPGFFGIIHTSFFGTLFSSGTLLKPPFFQILVPT